MNNENNNDNYTSGEFAGESQHVNSSQSSYNGHNSQQSNYNNYNSGGYSNSNWNTDYGYQNTIPNSAYPIPALKEGKEKKKKHGFFSAVKLTAAALVFGLIAGAAFQGYNVLTQPEDTNSDRDNTYKIEQAEESEQVVTPKDNSTDDTAVVPTSSSGEGIVTDVSDVVEKVMPSIVAINSTGTAVTYDFFGRQFNEPVAGSGSGIIIGQSNSEILIVTNNHVIEGAETVEIVFSDETTADATVKGADANADLAVVSVSMNDISDETAAAIKVATLGNSNEVKPGEMAIAIGNALGYGQSVTVGYISAVNRQVNIENVDMNLIQTDAAINPGNSGGALINATGQVIGINSVKYASEEVEGMGYAIPISDVVPMINDLMNREVLKESEKGFLGIRLDTAQNVTDIYSQRFNMPVGVYINDVVQGSPAETAGLKQGHIITKVNDRKIKTIDDLVNVLSYSKVGETITLTISTLDNGEYTEKELPVTLGERQ